MKSVAPKMRCAKVAKQVQRNRGQFHDDPATMPVFPCIASQFHDLGVNRVFNHVLDALVARFDAQPGRRRRSAFGQVSPSATS